MSIVIAQGSDNLEIDKEGFTNQNSNIAFSYNVGGDPDQTPPTVAYDLGLHSLSMSHKKDGRLIWVNSTLSTLFRSRFCYLILA